VKDMDMAKELVGDFPSWAIAWLKNFGPAH
jgi:hypothetical protein